MNIKPKSRLRRYSLRMMLVIITALATYFSVLANWKSRRATAIEWIEAQAEFWDDLPMDQGATWGALLHSVWESSVNQAWKVPVLSLPRSG